MISLKKMIIVIDKQMSPNKNPNQKRQRKGKGWSFSYWGGTPDKEEENNLPTTQETFPLAEATVGSQVSIVGFRGKDGVKGLLGMGLNLGSQLHIISSYPSGSVVVAVQDNQIGLGAGITKKIMVSVNPLLNGVEE